MLTDDERRRYARNLTLPEVGEQGQQRLREAKVLVIGAGGLGAASLPYLAAAGIGTLGIVDDDRVELSNLQRQVLYETGDIGRLKTEAARDRLEELNPAVKLMLHSQRITAQNAEAIVKDYDVIADGSDNFATRFAVNEACVRLQKPLVTAAIGGWEGQLAVFMPSSAPGQPCYRCMVSAYPEDERGCRDRGVMGAFAGMIGAMQGGEVIKLLLEKSTLMGKVFFIHGLTLVTKTSLVLQNPACDCCG